MCSSNDPSPFIIFFFLFLKLTSKQKKKKRNHPVVFVMMDALKNGCGNSTENSSWKKVVEIPKKKKRGVDGYRADVEVRK